jgi:hypothetical protein
MNGLRGELSRKHLFNKYNAIKTENGFKFKFERNSVNVFKLIGLDIGQLSHIIVEVTKNLRYFNLYCITLISYFIYYDAKHDGTDIHSSWFLQDILITNAKTNRSWFFECNDWLSRDHGLGKTRIQLLPTRLLEKYTQTEYKIVTITGNKNGSSTDSNV